MGQPTPTSEVTMRRLLPLVIVAALVATVGAAVVNAGAGPLPPDLQAVRAATAKYHSVDQAIADGYVAASGCESSPMGAMGIHFFNPARVGGPIDPLRPQVLLYLPRADGSLQLVGVEYFKPDADQNKATDDDRPFLFGQGFQGPMDGHNPQMPIHYDLHVWVHEQNPNGVFAQWNPALQCP
jgi:hypothetical protein